MSLHFCQSILCLAIRHLACTHSARLIIIYILPIQAAIPAVAYPDPEFGSSSAHAARMPEGTAGTPARTTHISGSASL